MLKTRYYFLRKLYPDTLLIFQGKKKCFVFEMDAELVKFIGMSKRITKKLEYYHINYIILDNLTIIISKQYEDNWYLAFQKKIELYEKLRKLYKRANQKTKRWEL